MNRGSPARIRRRLPSTTSFNEAPIHESGKYDVSFPCGGVERGFNEAPIHESGK